MGGGGEQKERGFGQFKKDESKGQGAKDNEKVTRGVI